MTSLDLMNENYQSSISISEMYAIADYMSALNKLDQETWERMREEMAGHEAN